MSGAPERVDGRSAALSIYRSAPQLDGLRTACLGGFECADVEAGAALLTETLARLRGEGFGAVLGPMDGNTWAKYRFVVESDGSPAFLMEPENPDWYPEAFERAGMQVVSRYVSSVRDMGDASKAAVAPEGVRLRAFRREKAAEALAEIHALSVQAFAANAFYTPIERDAFVGSYMPVVDMLDPDLVLMAVDDADALVGFLFAIPNIVEGAKPESVILKTYASLRKGVGSFLADTLHARALEKGFGRTIHALMHEDNLSATHSERTGGRVFRRYALYGVRL